MKIYHKLLYVLAEQKDTLTIVVVGANDGRINDPVYDFSMERPGKTQMVLIEPNSQLIPHLAQNYANHPCHTIANCAIGNGEALVLYTVKQDYWPEFQPQYAKDWPVYRAATGITSSEKSHLVKALKKENIDPEQAVESLSVPCRQLGDLLRELSLKNTINVLQVDAEGCDDNVIFASNIEDTRPELIYFESHNIDKPRLKALNKYLRRNAYFAFKAGGDHIAIAINRDLLSLTAITLLIKYTLRTRLRKIFG